jgi:predicted transcriptional regulator
MAVAVDQLARDLNLSPSDLLRRSIAAFLERERRAAQMDIADLQDRYGVRTSAELAAKIEQGEVYSHPAWEELIEWQNLEAYLERLARWQASVD